MKKKPDRKLHIVMNYDGVTGEFKGVEWEWRNSRCTKNGTAPTLERAVGAAEIAYNEWRREQR